MGLTPKREKFAQGVASGMTQADAYRAAFNTNARPSVVQSEASRLMGNPQVASRVNELRAPVIAKVGITLESHLADLEVLRDMAKDLGQMGAAITAEVARGRHAGVAAPEKREHTGKDGAPIAVTAVPPEEYRRIVREVISDT